METRDVLMFDRKKASVKKKSFKKDFPVRNVFKWQYLLKILLSFNVFPIGCSHEVFFYKNGKETLMTRISIAKNLVHVEEKQLQKNMLHAMHSCEGSWSVAFTFMRQYYIFDAFSLSLDDAQENGSKHLVSYSIIIPIGCNLAEKGSDGLKYFQKQILKFCTPMRKKNLKYFFLNSGRQNIFCGLSNPCQKCNFCRMILFPCDIFMIHIL